MATHTHLPRLLMGLIATFIVLAVAGSVVRAADADTTESITLSPTNKRYQLTAGETVHDEMTIINDGKAAYDFKVYAQPYSVSGEDYEADYISKTKNSDANEWVVFTKERYRAVPNEVLKIPFSFVVPKNAAPGGHYGVIFAETQASGAPASQTSIARQKRVGLIVYATVKGNFQTGGEILSQSSPFFQFSAPMKSHITIKNTGNTDFLAETVIGVADLFGNVKYKTSKSFAVLPETTRKVPFEWTQAPSFGLFKVTTKTSFMDTSKTSSQYVLMAPIFAYLILAVAIVASVIYFVQRR